MKPSIPPINPGAEYVFKYPFLRDVYTELIDDPEGGGTATSPCWKPGVDTVPMPPDGGDVEHLAHGEGFQRVAVISTHRPSSQFPERVFYVRQWEDPDGKRYGKGALRIKTTAAFRRLVAGYRLEYRIVEPEA